MVTRDNLKSNVTYRTLGTGEWEEGLLVYLFKDDGSTSPFFKRVDGGEISSCGISFPYVAIRLCNLQEESDMNSRHWAEGFSEVQQAERDVAENKKEVLFELIRAIGGSQDNESLVEMAELLLDYIEGTNS